MYFDHARCPSCGISFDPERVEVHEGAMACPGCKSQLQLKSLFGLAAAFEEEEAEHMTINDLIPGGAVSSEPPEGAKPSGHPQLTVRDVLNEKRRS